MKAKINEIFSSIQGEGPVVGYKQLFIRFCNCNLKCQYCDTKFKEGIEYSPKELYDKISKEYDLKSFHSISLTGGEPLLSADFLCEFLPLIRHEVKIYLETNATLVSEITKVRDYIDIISADIKLESSTGFNTIEKHNSFFEKCEGVYTFAKVVFDETITDKEIEDCIILGRKYNIELVLQPKMIGDEMSVSSQFCLDILNKFTSKYNSVRLIPQVHKFIQVI